MRGGVYSISATIIIKRANSGTAQDLKRIEAYLDEKPILDFSIQTESENNKGVVLDGFYWYFKGITIRNAGDNGMLLSGNNNVIDNCVFEKNRDTGLQLSRYSSSYTTMSQWPSNNLILNCESFDNKDMNQENADGFAAKLTCGEGNIFRGCISHNNIDDGWDLYTKTDTGPIGVILFENCVAYNNGTLSTSGTSGTGDKNGFKLGGSGISVNHIVRRCIAYGNGHHGFTDNNNLGTIEMSNNTSVNNADANYSFRANGMHEFRNNISYNSVNSDKITGTDVDYSNVIWTNKKSYNGRTPAIVCGAEDFVTLIPPVITKNADGSPNLGDFVLLNATSDFIDAGVPATGISFNGAAPDLGAREFVAPPALGINDFNSTTFDAIVSPNPVTDAINLFINSANAQNADLLLTSVNGQKVYSSKIQINSGSNTFSINQRGITKGFFILTIKSEDNQKSIKVIVK